MNTYIAIDLKSFYASVECIERALNPLTTNLVVANTERTEKTICLAVSPSLKSYGISGRARLYEVIQSVKRINAKRKYFAQKHIFTGSSCDNLELKNNPSLELSYIIAKPRMAFYINYSTRIYEIYLKYVSPQDIHVYSIDEVFIDATSYLKLYNLSAHEFAMKIILDILKTTGITATAGIGTNLYLAKIALDIGAKHIKPDKNGVRIASLDEMSYRKLLWSHRPLTDFWRIGRGYAKKLEENGLFTMGDIARCSLGKKTDYHNEDLLYKLFGVNAELLIDHAWGWESCTIEDIKAYKPEVKSISSGQVLKMPYLWDKAKIVIKEMADNLALSLMDKNLLTNQIVMDIGYDVENISGSYKGDIVIDRYGRKIPKGAHGSINLNEYTSSMSKIMDATVELFDKIINRHLSVRRLNITANHVISRTEYENIKVEQLNLFSQIDETKSIQEEKIQKTILDIKKKFGKNAILRGLNFEEGATGRERNSTIGGHRA